MNILTKSELLGYSRATRRHTRLNESLKTFSCESKSNKVTIFLSHKHDEIKELEAAISFLKQLGVDVYVDWMDEEMPKHTSGETAARIKRKIEENNKFIFLATDGAVNSKWCNWELGIGDVHKYIQNIAILPVKSDGGQYKGSEYLQIYPYIEKRYDYRNNVDYFVVYPDGTEIELKKWLETRKRKIF